MTKCHATSAQLGLGCNRLGSVFGASSRDAEILIRGAVDLGVRLFDTADVYGQGESERILGRTLGGHRSQVMVVTKAGQYFPQPWRAIQPLKNVLAPLVRSLSVTRNRLKKSRAGMLPQDFSPAHLTRAAERSLRRLRTESLDVYLLHSPSPDVLRAGEAIGALTNLKAAGKVRRIGVSCEEFATAFDALRDKRIEVIQFPVGSEEETARLLDLARGTGKTLIARGVTSGIVSAADSSLDDKAKRIGAMTRSLLAKPELSWVLIGTTKLDHLREVAAAVESTGTTEFAGS